MSKIKEYFEKYHSGYIIKKNSHSERKNSFSIKSEEDFSKIVLEKGVFKNIDIKTCECFFLRELNDETYFVELKGRSANVKKGIEQIMSSITEVDKLIQINPLKVNGFVIGSPTTRSNSSINILKRRFKSKYKKDIIIKTQNRYRTHLDFL